MNRHHWLLVASVIAAFALIGQRTAVAQTVTNGSFEANSFGVFPGYASGNGGVITGWTITGPTRVGLNPSSGSPFADNGTVPNGTNVAFIQSSGGSGTLAQTVSGLTIGQTYRISYYYNDRTGTDARLNATMGASTLLQTPSTFSEVGGTNPYYYAGNEFTATATSDTLTFANSATVGDSTLVFDKVAIAPATSNGLTTFAWTNDTTSRVSANWRYTAAADFGSGASPVINGVTFAAAGAAGNPAGTGFTTSGLGSTFTGDTNSVVTAGGGSGTMASTFNYGGATETITFSGLTVGRRYVGTMYTVGFDANPASRNITVSDGAGGSATINAVYGNDQGFGLEYSYTATAATQAFTFTQQSAGATFHNYGVSNRQNFLAWDGATGDWATASNWDAVNNTTTPPSTIDTYIDNGGTAQVTAGTASAQSLTVTNGTLSYVAGTLNVPTVNLGATGVFQAANPATQSFGGQITGTGNVQKTAGGTFNITNTNNTYTGITDISGGILNLASLTDYGVASSLGARLAAQETNVGNGIGIHLNGGTLQYTGSTPQSTNREIRMINGTSPTIDASGSNPAATLSFTHTGANTNLFDTGGTRTLTLTGSNTGDNLFAISLTDQAANATSLTKSGTGTWVVSGANTNTGTTTVSGGTLKAGSNTAFNNTNALSMSGSGVLDLNGFNAAFSNIAASATSNTITNNGAGPSRLGITAFGTTINSLLTDGSGTLGVDLTNSNSSVTVFNPANANTFSGGLTLKNSVAGTRLRIQNAVTTVGSPGAIVSSPFGRGAITIGEAATDKAQILFDVVANNTLMNDVIVNTTLGTDAVGSFRIDANAAGLTLAGNITANLAPAAFNLNGATATATVSGKIQGPQGVTKLGAGTLTLSNTTNSYAGVTSFDAGIVNVASLSNYGVNGSLGNRTAGQDVPTNIGLLFRGGTLQYTGSTAQSTDRAIRVSTTGGAFIDASGSNPAATMSFTRTTASPDFFESSGARQITFTGSNTGANTFAMPIQSTGGLTTVNKTGAGRWVLSGASTYTGPTFIQAGTLQIEHSTALGAGTFSTNDYTVISNDAALHINGNLAITEHFRVQGDGPDNLGAIRSLSGTSSISQNMGLDATTEFGVNTGSQLTIVNDVYVAAGTPGLTKSGGGTLVLQGNNSYTGTTNIEEGVIRAENSNALGTGGFAVTPKTTIFNDAALHISGNLSIPEHIHVQGDGPDNLGAIRSLSGTSSLTNHISLDAATTIGVNASSQLTISGQIYDNIPFVGNTLTKLGAGTLTLSHPGTFTTPYSGATLVQEGTVEVTVNGALGSITGATTVSDGARLLLSNTNYTTTETLNLDGAGIGGLNGALHATGTSRWDGNINVVDDATIYVPTGSNLTLGTASTVITKNGTTLTLDGGGLITVNGQITGATDHTSDLDINGGSTVILTNVNNNYMGPTNINNGTLQNGLSNVVPNGSEITFGSAGAASTYDLASFSDTVRGLSSTAAGNGVVRNSVNATNSNLTLAPQGTETWTFTGSIQQNPGTVNLDMAGAAGSTQQLGGPNTYTGTTTVTSGTLELISGGSLQNSAVNVNGGTFQQSAGTNNVTGGSGTGNLTVTGSGQYNLDGGTLDFHDYQAGGATTWTPGAGNESTITVPTAAQFSFTGGTLQDVSTITVGGGSGTFEQNGGNFVVGQNGTGPAALTTIDGGYSLLDGVLRLDIFGDDLTPEECCDNVASNNDQLTVMGDAFLDSTISLNYAPGYEPEFGDVFTLLCADDIDYGSGFHVDGGFFRIVPSTGDPNGPMALQAIVPEPASVAVWSLVGFAGLLGAVRLRGRRLRQGAQC